MKRLFLPVLIGIVLAGCQKQEEVSRSYELSTHPGWSTERFKAEYDIQFPPHYTGSGMITFEGNTFRKYNTPESTQFWYSYDVNGVFFADFGPALNNPAQESVEASFFNGEPFILLPERIEFTLNNQLTGIFFHDKETISHGRLFWKDADVFKEALNVWYKPANLPEVIEILRSINKK